MKTGTSPISSISFKLIGHFIEGMYVGIFYILHNENSQLSCEFVNPISRVTGQGLNVQTSSSIVDFRRRAYGLLALHFRDLKMLRDKHHNGLF